MKKFKLSMKLSIKYRIKVTLLLKKVCKYNHINLNFMIVKDV